MSNDESIRHALPVAVQHAGNLTQPYGYHGRYLRIDLTTRQSQFVRIPDAQLRRFIGGSGLGAYLLLEEGQATVDPLAPESGLAFVFSPLVGSPVTTSAKFAVVSKSPLTQRFNDSLVSSTFAIAGKRLGCDAIYITGQVENLSVLLIDDESIRIEAAHDLMGLDTVSTEKQLRENHASHQFAVIGPAGENVVRFATISHDGRHSGRGGNGAILGSKNIKAIGVRGDQKCSWAHPDQLVRLAKDLSSRSFGPATAKYRELGTASNLLVFNRLNALPTRNFQAGSFSTAAQIAPETMSEVRTKTREYCAACTIGCEHIYGLKSEPQGVRLEYENLFALGSLCGIDDPEMVLRASKRCDELGIDTISAGGTIAFAMECVERGLLDEPWLKFGDGQAMLLAIDLIAKREGLGEMLAFGSRHFAEALGGDTIAFAPQVKGLEIPGYHPNSLQTMAIGFAVNARGADHNRSGAYEADFSGEVDRHNPNRESVQLAIEAEDRSAIIDSMILCKFLRGIFDDLYAESAEILRLVTGWEIDGNELRESAAAIIEAKKKFNIAAGWQPEEDTLPPRFFEQTVDDHPESRLSRENFSELVRFYNVQRGWTEEGWVSIDDEPAVPPEM